MLAPFFFIHDDPSYLQQRHHHGDIVIFELSHARVSRPQFCYGCVDHTEIPVGSAPLLDDSFGFIQ